MASPKKKAPPRKVAPSAGGQTIPLRKIGLIFVLFLAVIMVSAPASLILLLVGLMPTGVACVIDRERGMPLAISVGALNGIGVFYFTLDLWLGKGGFGAAFAIITNVFDLVVIYGLAAFGWIIYLGMPSLAATYVAISQDMRIQKLTRHQENLIAEWGDGVAKGGRN